MTEEEVREKVRLNRIELLKKAREAKATKKLERSKVNDTIVEEVLKEPEVIVEEKPKKVRAKKEKEVKQEIEIKPEVKDEVVTKKKEVKPEVVEEVVRIPANRRKKIVKRTIEIEESETDEEIVEEIVKIPKMKKEIKFSRDEMKSKLINQNLNRLHNELFQ
jgi:hypothetical protein